MTAADVDRVGDPADPFGLDRYLAAVARPEQIAPHEVEDEVERVAKAKAELDDLLGVDVAKLREQGDHERAEYVERRLPEVEREVVPRWKIEDDQGAEWAMAELRVARREFARVHVLAVDRLDAITTWRDRTTEPFGRSIAFFEALLADYNARRIAADPKAKRTLELPSGAVPTSTSTAVEVTDEAALRAWIDAGGRKSLLGEPQPLPIAKAELRRFVDPDADRPPKDADDRPFVLNRVQVDVDPDTQEPIMELRLIERETGEIVPGVVIAKEVRHNPKPDLTG